MRVIAGSAKKRQLKVPQGWQGRPTADRVKESLFNIIAPRIAGSTFLDLFAGTGNIAVEALSRGAEKAVLVEKDPRAVRVIKENLALTGFANHSMVLQRDVIQALCDLGGRAFSFNIIFLDPPYEKGHELPVLESIINNHLLSPSGLIIVETSKRDVMPESVSHLFLNRRERYGDTVLWFYECREALVREEDKVADCHLPG